MDGRPRPKLRAGWSGMTLTNGGFDLECTRPMKGRLTEMHVERLCITWPLSKRDEGRKKKSGEEGGR